MSALNLATRWTPHLLSLRVLAHFALPQLCDGNPVMASSYRRENSQKHRDLLSLSHTNAPTCDRGVSSQPSWDFLEARCWPAHPRSLCESPGNLLPLLGSPHPTHCPTACWVNTDQGDGAGFCKDQSCFCRRSCLLWLSYQVVEPPPFARDRTLNPRVRSHTHTHIHTMPVMVMGPQIFPFCHKER